MTGEPNVIPSQPRRRLVLRRVRAHRFASAAALFAPVTVVSVAFDLDAVLVHHTGLMFWLSVFLLGTVLICTLVALVLSFIERPKEVEILEGHTPRDVI